jgi:hypothetical protein
MAIKQNMLAVDVARYVWIRLAAGQRRIRHVTPLAWHMRRET